MRWFRCSCGNEFPEEEQNISEYKAGQCPSCGSDDVDELDENGVAIVVEKRLKAVENTKGIWKNLPKRGDKDDF